jgi:hypothetical protein
MLLIIYNELLIHNLNTIINCLFLIYFMMVNDFQAQQINQVIIKLHFLNYINQFNIFLFLPNNKN